MKNSRTKATITTAAITAAFLLAAPLTASALSPSSGSPAGGAATTIDGIHFVSISAGDSYSLGLTSEGSIYAWGFNGDGELGNASNTDSATPVQVHGVGDMGYLTGVTSIAAGYTHSVAVTASGVFAWGDNSSGELGDGTTNNSNTPVQVEGVAGTGYLTGVTAVAAAGGGNSGGYGYSIALTPTGIFTWGGNTYGQLGDGTLNDSSTPVQVTDVGGTGHLTGATAISAGRYFSVALTSAGVFAWGDNDYGQLGNGTNGYTNTPVQVKDVAGTGYLTGVTSISAGSFHSLALTSTGVFAWGKNSNGRLGDGTTNDSNTPVQVKDVLGTGYLSGVTSIAAGSYHSLALTPTGVFAWGQNIPNYGDGGQLGNGTTVDSALPVQVQGVGGSGSLSGATSITGGKFHSLAITPAGIFGWGTNGNGELGDGSTSSITTPVLGANFEPLLVTFGGVVGNNLSADGSLWGVTVPAGAVGTVDVIGTASIFGGTTAAFPATVTFNAGAYTYVDGALANTGVTGSILPIGLTLMLLGLGLASITALVRRRTTA